MLSFFMPRKKIPKLLKLQLKFALLSLFFFGAPSISYAQESHSSTTAAGDYAIDEIDKIIKRDCPNCSGHFGETFLVTPVTKHSGFPAKDLKVFGCHVTLVEKNVVLTAAHCLRAWTQLDWKSLSQDDCSKMMGFYFPKTSRFPHQAARCKRIVSEIYLKSGVPQLEPDHIFIELDRDIERELIYPSWNSAHPPWNPGTLSIWGYNSERKRIEKRSCSTLKAASVLTPMGFWGFGNYQTITCDGEIEQGWSGSGVFNEKNELIGVVSFGASYGFSYGGTLFGSNEVAISLLKCRDRTSSNGECFVNKDLRDAFLEHIYLAAADQAKEWQLKTIQLLEKNFSAVKLKYQPSSIDDGPSFSPPGFSAYCRKKESDALKPSLVVAKADKSSLRAKFVVLNDDTTIKGVIENPSEGSGGSFSLQFELQRGDISHLPICEE